MSERWKAVSGYEGRYEVSTRGRVRSLAVNGRGSQSRKSRTQLISTVTEGGYLRVGLWDGKKVRLHRVHRLVALAFIPHKRAEQNTVNHRDGNRRNNRLSNLEWATMHEQNLHKYAVLGLVPCRGERNGAAKLTEADVRAIRASYEPHVRGRGYNALADRFNVSKVTIWRIIHRRSWSHVT